MRMILLKKFASKRVTKPARTLRGASGLLHNKMSRFKKPKNHGHRTINQTKRGWNHHIHATGCWRSRGPAQRAFQVRVLILIILPQSTKAVRVELMSTRGAHFHYFRSTGRHAGSVLIHRVEAGEALTWTSGPPRHGATVAAGSASSCTSDQRESTECQRQQACQMWRACLWYLSLFLRFLGPDRSGYCLFRVSKQMAQTSVSSGRRPSASTF